jgi:PilZ domain
MSARRGKKKRPAQSPKAELNMYLLAPQIIVAKPGLSMGKTTDRRLERRQKVCVQAFASDLGDAIDTKCVIRDVSKTGCKIVTSQIQDLPELFQLIVEGIDQPIRGKIVWRRGKMAGVCFEHACSDEIRSSIETLYNSLREDEECDVLILGCGDEWLSYSARLKKYDPLRV